MLFRAIFNEYRTWRREERKDDGSEARGIGTPQSPLNPLRCIVHILDTHAYMFDRDNSGGNVANNVYCKFHSRVGFLGTCQIYRPYLRWQSGTEDKSTAPFHVYITWAHEPVQFYRACTFGHP